ncbi:MAG: hypothetical protein H6625_09500 [Bdellovibrionaceae bacterium]|nr:hypothetical protein [Pseudobdellovibrionaceae bacterium]
MKLLNIILLLFFAFTGIIQQNTWANENSIPCYRLLDPSEKVWGTYKCNSCKSETSAKKRQTGRQDCYHCGNSHTNEEFIPPHHIVRDGKTYVLANAPIQIKDGSEGNLWSCPFCTSTNFIDVTECPGCGAVADLNKVKRVGDAGRKVNPSEGGERPTEFSSEGDIQVPIRNSNPLSPNYSGDKNRPASSKSKIAIKPKGESDRTFLESIPKPLKAAVSAALAVGAAGVIWWGTQTHAHMGEVVHVDSQNISVEYMDGYSKEILELKANPNETIPWRIGEKIEIHFTNFSGAQGGERSNGELLESN